MNRHTTLGGMVSGSLLAGLCCAAQWLGRIRGAQSAAPPSGAIPDFSSGGKTWVLINGTQFYKVPGDTGPGPIDDKNFPNGAFARQGGGGARTVNRIADTSNPILKPWAKKLMDIANERVAAGGIPFVDDSRCWLGGVPSLLLFPGEAVVFLPDSQRGLDPLQARRSSAAHIYERASQQESGLFLDGRIGGSLRKWRHPGRRYDRT